MHAAIIAREVAKSRFGAKTVPALNTFLLRDPFERILEANKQVLSALGTIAKKMGAKEASKKLKAARLRGKKKKSGARSNK